MPYNCDIIVNIYQYIYQLLHQAKQSYEQFRDEIEDNYTLGDNEKKQIIEKEEEPIFSCADKLSEIIQTTVAGIPRTNDEYEKDCERRIIQALIGLIKVKEPNFRYAIIKEIFRTFPAQRNKLAEVYYQKLFTAYINLQKKPPMLA